MGREGRIPPLPATIPAKAGIHPPSLLYMYMPAPLPVRMVRQAHHERAGEARTAPLSVRPELVEGPERSGPLLSQGWSCGARSVSRLGPQPFLPPSRNPSPLPSSIYVRAPSRSHGSTGSPRTGGGATNGPYLSVRPELVEGARTGDGKTVKHKCCQTAHIAPQ